MVASWLSRVLSPFFRSSIGRGRTKVRLRRYFPWPDLNRLLAARMRFEALEDRTAPALFTVTTAADSGLGSLRQALLDANGTAGADTIQFAIGSGLQTITPASPLPVITDPVILDATTQPGFTGTPLIELSGVSAGSSAGLTMESNGSTVRGFSIVNYYYGGIEILGGDGNSLVGNYIGLFPDGITVGANDFGIQLIGGSDANTIGGTTAADRNVICGNDHAGINVTGSTGGLGFLQAGAVGNVITGNYIGVAADGTTARPNGDQGIRIAEGASNTTVGGTTAGAGNVIAGNTGNGVLIDGPAVTAGAKGWWRGEGNAGSTTLLNGGTAVNGVSYGAGTSGSAFQFDGVDDYIDLPVIPLTSGLTFAAWIKTTSADAVSAYDGDAANNVIGRSDNSVWLGFGVHGGKVRYSFANASAAFEYLTGSQFRHSRRKHGNGDLVRRRSRRRNGDF
jgi:hypothetical protein